MAPLNAWCEGLGTLFPGGYHNIARRLGDCSGLGRVGGGGRSLLGLWHEILHSTLNEHEDAHALGNGGEDLRAMLVYIATQRGVGKTCALALLGRLGGCLCLWHDGSVRNWNSDLSRLVSRKPKRREVESRCENRWPGRAGGGTGAGQDGLVVSGSSHMGGRHAGIGWGDAMRLTELHVFYMLRAHKALRLLPIMCGCVCMYESTTTRSFVCFSCPHLELTTPKYPYLLALPT